MVDQLSVTDNILQIAHQAYFEARLPARQEHNRVNGFLTTSAIILFGEFIEKLKVDGAFKSSVKAVYGYSIGKMKGVEQLGLIVLFALQEFLLRY